MSHIIRTPKQLGEVLQRKRKQLNLTQATLGERSHLRQATISDIEKGMPGTELGTFFDVLSALGLECTIRPRSKSSLEDMENIF